MSKYVNFEDNIFVLNIRIRMIKDMLVLNTDAELFLNKTMDDLDFINICLSTLLAKLKENIRFIERDEQFHNLANTEQQFCEMLKELDRGKGNISANHNPQLREQIILLLSHSQTRQNTIKELVADSKHIIQEPVVGHDELQELFQT